MVTFLFIVWIKIHVGKITILSKMWYNELQLC